MTSSASIKKLIINSLAALFTCLPPLTASSQTGHPATISVNGAQLQVHPTDHETNLPWGTDYHSSQAVSPDDGKANTQQIVEEFGNWNNGNYAAKICADLNAFGHSDWYLPARDQLQAMYRNRSLIGNFSSGHYWSSTHDKWGYNAYMFDAFSGFPILQPKFNQNRVRCVRNKNAIQQPPDSFYDLTHISEIESEYDLFHWININIDNKQYALFTDSDRSFSGEVVFSVMNKDHIHGIYIKDLENNRFLCDDNELKRRTVLMLAENKARHLNAPLDDLQACWISNQDMHGVSRIIQGNSFADDLIPGNISQSGIGALLDFFQNDNSFDHTEQTLYYPSFKSNNLSEIENWGNIRVWLSLTGSGLYHYNKRKSIYKNIVYALIIPEYGSQSSNDDSVFRQFEDEYDRLYADVYDNALANTINSFYELPAATTALSVFTEYYVSGLENQLFDAGSVGMVVSSQWLHLSWLSGLQSALSHYGNVAGVAGIGQSAFAASTKALMLQAYSAGLAQQRLSALHHIISSGMYNENIAGYDQAFIDAFWEVFDEFSNYQNNFWREVVRDIVNDYSFWRSTITFGSVKIASKIYGKVASITAAKVLLPVAILHWAWDEVTSSNTLAQQIALTYSLNQSLTTLISYDTDTYDELITQLYLQEWKYYLSYYFYGNYVRLMDYNIVTGFLQKGYQWIVGGNWSAYKQLHEDYGVTRQNILRMFMNYHAPYFGLASNEYDALVNWAFGLLRCMKQVGDEHYATPATYQEYEKLIGAWRVLEDGGRRHIGYKVFDKHNLFYMIIDETFGGIYLPDDFFIEGVDLSEISEYVSAVSMRYFLDDSKQPMLLDIVLQAHNDDKTYAMSVIKGIARFISDDVIEYRGGERARYAAFDPNCWDNLILEKVSDDPSDYIDSQYDNSKYEWVAKKVSCYHSFDINCFDRFPFDENNDSSSHTDELVHGGYAGNSGTFRDPRDGQTYRWVQIGNQVWMAENLNYQTRNSWCYNDIEKNCDHFGRLYTWRAAMNRASSSNSNPSGVQGVCPPGWHLPSNAEWHELLEYVTSLGHPNKNDHPNSAGNALKSCKQVSSPFGQECHTFEHPSWDANPVNHGFDKFGFAALPAGHRARDGLYHNAGNRSIWWSSTHLEPIFENLEPQNAYRRVIYSSGGVEATNMRITSGYSVRCIRN